MSKTPASDIEERKLIGLDVVSRKNTYEINRVVKYLELRLEDLKNQLIDNSSPELRGRAQEVRRIINEFTGEPVIVDKETDFRY